MNDSQLKKLLKSDFEIYPLKNKKKIKLSNRKPLSVRKPTVCKLVTEDGRKYKIHEVESSENEQIRRIIAILPQLKQLQFVPKIIYDDKYTLIMEYIDGSFPEFKTGLFSSTYARNMANLHKIQETSVSAADYLEKGIQNLKILKLSGKLTKKVEIRLRDVLKRNMPDEIRQGLEYVDVRVDNFVQTENIDLYFIDLGSFRENAIIGEFFYSRNMYQEVDLEVFYQHYEAVMGDSYLFDNADFLTLVGKINLAVECVFSLKRISIVRQWRKRRSRKALINRTIGEILSFAR